MNTEERTYQEFFKEEIYDGFVEYLLNKYGAGKVNLILRDMPLMTKRGVNVNFSSEFSRFIHSRPSILKVFADNEFKTFNLRNIAGGQLAFPIDVEDEGLMIREGIRIPHAIPVDLKDAPRSTPLWLSAGPMKGQVIRGEIKERKYLHPKRLTVHFKESYAQRIGKTTMSFMVTCRSEAMDILLGRYPKRVAYAQIVGEEEFCFVKPRNGKKKRNRKLRSEI